LHRLHNQLLIQLFALVSGFLIALNICGPCAAQTGIQYEVVIEGIADDSLRKDMESISATFSLRERFSPSMNLLRHRSQKDIEQFQKVLRAQGYYGAEIAVAINEYAQPVRVSFQIDPGPVYLFKSIEIKITGRARDLTLPAADRLGLKVGQPALAKSVIDAEEALLTAIKDKGFPFPKVDDRRVVVDHRSKDVTVSLEVDPGPEARFGSTTIEGLQSVEESFVLAKLPWQKGEKFNASLLTEYRKRLTDTKLFSVVRIDYAEHLDEHGLLPMRAQVTERKHRSVRAGAAWSSDEGFGGKLSWEHRNLLEKGERLYLGVIASQIDVSLQSVFEKPSFLRDDQSLVASFNIANETTNAYDSENVSGTVLIDRKIREKMVLGAGLGFRSSKVTQLEQTKDFQLFYLPAHFDWDRSNNLLDPTAGGRLKLQLAPYYDVAKSNLGFVKGLFAYSHYFKLLEKPFVLFAGRIAAGSISGADFEDIPADLRFYAGGGGSIRGYAYQKVGPLVDKDPIGGRSLLEFSAELRFKITETIGFVAFLDGGSAFEDTYPDFSETIRWGAGPGVRYYTPIGPLRLDIGFPLNKRSGVDDPYQIYVSIGQAF